MAVARFGLAQRARAEAKAFVRSQVEEHQKQPIRALGRKTVLRMRMDRPEALQGAVWAVDDIGEGVGLQAGRCLSCSLQSSEVDLGEIGQIHFVIGGFVEVNREVYP